MKFVLVLAASLLLGGCTAQVVGPGPVVVEEGAPIEYYYWGGHYHYWHDNNYVVVERVPEGHHWVSVDRQPDRPLARRANEKRGEHRDIEEKHERER